MQGFSIATNEWGIHAILYKGFTDADPKAWLSALKDAVDRMQARGRRWGVFLDLRNLGSDTMAPAQAQALCALLSKADVGRSAMVASGAATALRMAIQKTETLTDVRFFAADGRDRFTIAAAYTWILNARDPDVDAQVTQSKAGGGEIVPFAKRRRLSAVPNQVPGAAPENGLRNVS